MMFPLRRWNRGQPLSSVTWFVKRWLHSRHHSLWILLILLGVCIAIQTFAAHQARNDKLIGLQQMRFPVNKENQFHTVRRQNLRSQQTERSAHGNHQNEGYGKPLYSLIISLASSQAEVRKASLGKLLLPKDGSKPNLGLPASLAHHSTSKGLNLSTEQTIISSPTTSNFLKAHINSTHTKATCHPKSHIVFLKTHKTGSSTILNMLYRYGETRNLTFALPLHKHSQLFYPFFFAPHFVEGVSSRRVKEFHIMCNHMRFKKSEVAKVMPEDTFYFSILRHPVAMMESLFSYYKSIPAFRKSYSLEDFLNNSWKTYNPSVANNHYAHNILAFDFGFQNNVAAGAADLEERATVVIAAIEKDFNLILISEYFDESMVLLKHSLCWSLEDMVSFRLNSRSEKTRHSLLPNTAEKIKMWNALDWKIYLHFNTTFWHKVEILVGQEEMEREVAQLRELQAKLAKTCLKDGGAVDPSLVKDAGLKPFQYGTAVIQGYNLKPNLDIQTKTKCQKLILPELQYTDYLYNKQFPEAAAKHRQATKIVKQVRQRVGKTAMMGKKQE